MVFVELSNVTIQFRIRQNWRIPLKHFLLHHLFRASVNPATTVTALDNVTLRLTEGERVGVIGHNGAGKSTFLKLLSGIYVPTQGTIQSTGRISNLLDFGLGIEPDADGWSNIAYRSYLQGATPQEVRQRRDEIAEFTELGEKLNHPLRTYSTGSIVRLCFAIATSVDPEILLVDEVLSAGDLAFQKKARQRMLDLIEKTRLLVFASHDLETLRALCTRILWFKNGQVHRDGDVDAVLEEYRDVMLQSVSEAA